VSSCRAPAAYDSGVCSCRGKAKPLKKVTICPRIRTPLCRLPILAPTLQHMPGTGRPTLYSFLAQPKSDKAELDDEDKAFQQKKREEAAALKKLKEVAGAKGGFAKVTATGKKK